jgi:hypothetical protein
VRQFLDFCRARGVMAPDQIGRSHIWSWFESLPGAAESTLRDRYYAACLFWRIIGRSGDPPKPRVSPRGS